jgi:hypothetical protein
MDMSGRSLACFLVFVAALLGTVGPSRGEMDGGGGAYRNLIVRELKVSPVRAHVGDVIAIEMVVEDAGDLYVGDTVARIYANGKMVAHELYAYGYGGEGGRIRKASFRWDTRDEKPGEYRIRGEVFLWEDSSPFDNRLDLAKPVVLYPKEAIIPSMGGKESATGIEVDPRWKRSTLSSGHGTEPVPEAGY